MISRPLLLRRQKIVHLAKKLATRSATISRPSCIYSFNKQRLPRKYPFQEWHSLLLEGPCWTSSLKTPLETLQSLPLKRARRKAGPHAFQFSPQSQIPHPEPESPKVEERDSSSRRFQTDQISGHPDWLRGKRRLRATRPPPRPAAWRWPESCRPPVAARCRSGPSPCGSCLCPGSCW